MPKILAVMAHPDDAEILIAGTLFQLKSLGWEIGIVTMTGGDCGSATRTREEISRIRYAEAKAAAGFLGAWYRCAGSMDLEIFANPQTIRKVVELMREFIPDVVVTHSPVDYMLDHEETSRIARGAAFAAPIPLYQTQCVPPSRAIHAVPALYYADPLEGVDPMGKRIVPQFYVDISETIEMKRRMLEHHSSQREWLRTHHGIDEYINQMVEWSSRFGRECNTNFAEGFRQHRGHGYPKEPILQNALAKFVEEPQ